VLTKYPTTYEEDVKLLSSSTWLTFNQKNCIHLRMSEKRIISQIILTAENVFELASLER
jgi:hypothetical protein